MSIIEQTWRRIAVHIPPSLETENRAMFDMALDLAYQQGKTAQANYEHNKDLWIKRGMQGPRPPAPIRESWK